MRALLMCAAALMALGIASCGFLDEAILGPAPADQQPPAVVPEVQPDGTIVYRPVPTSPAPTEGWAVRLLREATRSIPWSGPAITLATWLFVRLRRRTNQLRAMIGGVDYAVHNGDLTKPALYQAIENAARTLTGLSEFRQFVARIKAENRTTPSGS